MFRGEREFNTASRFLFLDMTIKVIQSDIKRVELKSPFKINEPYIALLHRLEIKAVAERKLLKQEMMKEGIYVFFKENDGTFTEYQFTCKGKQEKRRYFNPAIRSKVEKILDELLNDKIEEKV